MSWSTRRRVYANLLQDRMLMRVLLDHNVPMPLCKLLIGHKVETAYIRGWSQLVNGALISAAENDGFDLVITTDKGIRYQMFYAA